MEVNYKPDLICRLNLLLKLKSKVRIAAANKCFLCSCLTNKVWPSFIPLRIEKVNLHSWQKLEESFLSKVSYALASLYKKCYQLRNNTTYFPFFDRIRFTRYATLIVLVRIFWIFHLMICLWCSFQYFHLDWIWILIPHLFSVKKVIHGWSSFYLVRFQHEFSS